MSCNDSHREGLSLLYRVILRPKKKKKRKGGRGKEKGHDLKDSWVRHQGIDPLPCVSPSYHRSTFTNRVNMRPCLIATMSLIHPRYISSSALSPASHSTPLTQFPTALCTLLLSTAVQPILGPGIPHPTGKSILLLHSRSNTTTASSDWRPPPRGCMSPR